MFQTISLPIRKLLQIAGALLLSGALSTVSAADTDGDSINDTVDGSAVVADPVFVSYDAVALVHPDYGDINGFIRTSDNTTPQFEFTYNVNADSPGNSAGIYGYLVDVPANDPGADSLTSFDVRFPKAAVTHSQNKGDKQCLIRANLSVDSNAAQQLSIQGNQR